MRKKLKIPPKTLLIREFIKQGFYNKATDEDNLKTAIMVDVETTGLSADAKIIELAMVPFVYNTKGQIIKVLASVYSSFQDPGEPIPELTTKLTGITDAMVEGQGIDLGAVENLLENADLLIAHNASFDKSHLLQLSETFGTLPWACSQKDINWMDHCITGTKLDYLCFRFGFFYEAHRAESDCRATIHLLSHQFEDTKSLLMEDLLNNSRKMQTRFFAVGAPFEEKDKLKERGYRWNADLSLGKHKAWCKDVDAVDGLAEHDWLKRNVYSGSPYIPTEHITALNRY